jgi:hypothetical protein
MTTSTRSGARGTLDVAVEVEDAGGCGRGVIGTKLIATWRGLSSIVDGALCAPSVTPVAIKAPCTTALSVVPPVRRVRVARDSSNVVNIVLLLADVT